METSSFINVKEELRNALSRHLSIINCCYYTNSIKRNIFLRITLIFLSRTCWSFDCLILAVYKLIYEINLILFISGNKKTKMLFFLSVKNTLLKKGISTLNTSLCHLHLQIFIHSGHEQIKSRQIFGDHTSVMIRFSSSRFDRSYFHNFL